MAIVALSQSVESTPLTVPHDRRNGNSRGLTQAYELRDLAANTAMALKEELTQPDGKLIIRRDEYGKPVDAPAIAQLIRAWSEAREAIRILRGRPLPGSLRPERKQTKRKPRAPIAPIARVSEQAQARDASRPPATPVSPPDAKATEDRSSPDPRSNPPDPHA